MKTGQAKRILHCSYSSIQNYLKDGRLRLTAQLANGRYEIDDGSVYALAAEQFASGSGNCIVMFSSSGEVFKFLPSDADFRKVAECLSAGIIST